MAETPQQKKPYVRYRLSGDIHEKGLGFSVKKAVETYLERNGFEGRAKMIEVSSSRFEMVLDIYDNGKTDFNVQALQESIKESKQMPTRRDIIPSVEVKPIPYDVPSPEARTDSDERNVAWQKTCEQLTERVREYEEQIQTRGAAHEREAASLTELLQTKQKAIAELNTRIGGLEARLSSTEPVLYTDAISAVIKGYVPSCTEKIFEAVTNWTTLSSKRDREFIVGIRGDLKYIKYVNAATGLSLKDESELEAMKQAVGSANTWEETEEGKKVSGQRQKLDVDRRALELVRGAGASEDMIKVMVGAIQSQEETMGGLETKTTMTKAVFARQKDACAMLPSLTEDYKIVEGVYAEIRGRKKVGADFPVIIHPCEKYASVKFYLPNISFTQAPAEAEKELIQHVYNLPGLMLRGGTFNAADAENLGDCTSLVVKFSNMSAMTEAMHNLSEDAVKREPILTALGLTPKLVLVMPSE